MAFVKVASAKNVSSAGKISVKAGGKEIMLAAVKGKFYAIGNKCTHMGCKLSEGEMDGENVTCPCHSSMFSLKDGTVVKGPAKKAEPSFKVKVQGDDVMVDV